MSAQIEFDPHDSPTMWFALLERARTDGDYEAAADAIRELRRLGVEVSFSRKTTARKARVVSC